MARRRKKHPKFKVGSRVSVRVIREKDGRLYWRAESYDSITQSRTTVWTGWGEREEVERIITRLVADMPDLGVGGRSLTKVRTVLDLMETWVGVQEARKDISQHTVRVYRTNARHIAGATIAQVRLDRLGMVHLERYRDERIREGAATRTLRGEMEVLHFAWRWWADVSPSPLRNLPKVRINVKPVRNRRTPPKEDVLRVLAELKGWHRLVVYLLAATGARPGEIQNLTWADIDWHNMELRVSGKTGLREIPISASVLEELRAWKEETGGEGSLWPIKPSTFGVFGPTVLRRACERAGVPVFTPYGLRRSAVDRMARAGVDPATAASITGHSAQVMLQHYRKVSSEDRRDAIRRAGLGETRSGDVVEFRRR